MNQWKSYLLLQADWIIETNRPPNDWPQEGKIQVDELNIRYREELPMALEDVTFDVKAGEKVIENWLRLSV